MDRKFSNKIVIIIFLLFFHYNCHAQQMRKINIAVVDLEVSNVESSIKKALSDRLRAELIGTGRFYVMERNKMNSILEEQGFQQTGIFNDETIVEVGRLLGVERMIAGSVGKVGSIYTISLRMIDLKTGRITDNQTEDCDGTIETILTKSLRNIAFKMAGFSSKGKITINGSPKGADIFIRGTRIGKLPLDNYQLDKGTYNVEIKNKGFESCSGKINILPNTRRTFEVRLNPKSKIKALKRSLFFPGLGQSYLDEKGKAFLFPLLEVSAIVGASVFESEFRKALEEYNTIKIDYSNCISQLDIDNYYAKMKNKYDEIESSEKMRNIFISAALGVWLWNVLDVALKGQSTEMTQKIDQKKFGVYSKRTSDISLIGISIIL